MFCHGVFFSQRPLVGTILIFDQNMLITVHFEQNELFEIEHRLCLVIAFSGLGWMLTSKLWDELKVKWPETFWDDWMRDPAQRQGRACIRPEISRTGISFRGKKGVSKYAFSYLSVF